MFITNDRNGRYYNGSQGEVIGFVNEAQFELGIMRIDDFSADSFPVVKLFSDNSYVLASPVEWTIEETNEESGEKDILASAWQVPLKLSYALTIHKAQGCTFDYVNLDMSDVFQKNMGYVALSRVSSLNGLWLKGFNDISLLVDDNIVKKYIEFEKESKKHE